MNLRELVYLVAVADHGSLRKAAVACGVSQPTLSAQLKRLEAELGTDLLDRSTIPLRLTPVGEDVVARARRLLQDAEEIREAARQRPEGEASSLRLGVFPTLGAYLLPTVLAGVRARFPQVDLLITERRTTSLMRLLDGGELDAVVVAMPVDRPDLEVRPLFREDFLVVVPRDHELAVGEGPLRAADVVDTEFILLTEGHCLADQVASWLVQIGGNPRLDYRASSLESLRSMVAAGSGATLLPALAMREPGPLGKQMATRDVIDPVPSRDLALVWRRGSTRTDLLHRLAEALVPTDSPHVVPLG